MPCLTRLAWAGFNILPARPTAGLEQTLLRKKIVLPANKVITNAVFAIYADNFCNTFINGQVTSNSAVRWDATAKINVTA